MTSVTSYPELKQLQDRADAAAAAVTAAQGALDAAVSRGALRAIVLAERRLARARTAATAAAGAMGAATAATAAALDPAVPVLLLPVRLETRYDLSSTQTGGPARLKVRVYPDDVHLDGHEPELAPAEVEAGLAFWATCWEARSGADVATRQRAWIELASRFGAERAAWIVRELTPVNLTSAGPGDPPDHPHPGSRTGLWTRATLARLLPDFWRVQAWRGDTCVGRADGRLIPDPLPAGLDPTAGSATAGLDWMTDFDVAVDAGMGVVLDLAGQDPREPLDLLTVVGVRGTQSATDGARDLADLLTAHRFSTGLDLLDPGTPTTSSDLGRSAHGAADPGGAARFVDPFATTVPVRPTPGDGGDADLLTAALALPVGTAGGLPGGGQSGVALERDLATALWPGTWGYYLTQMLRLDEWDTGAAGYRRWVLDRVRGGGPLPTVRVGRQPYGVLPVLPLERWRPTGSEVSGLVAVELVAPRKRVPVRGVGVDPVTQVRVLTGLDDAATWSYAVPTTFRLPTPAGASTVAVASADVDGDGRTELVVAHAATVPGGPPLVTLSVVSLEATGPRVVRQVALGQLPDGSVATPALPVGAVRGLAVALGAPGREQGPDLVVVVQVEPALRGAAAETVVVTATGFGGPQQAWAAPVDLGARLGPAERVTSAALVPDGRRGGWLVLVTEDPKAPTGDPTARWRVASLRRPGSALRWSAAEPVGPAAGAGSAPVSAALAVTRPEAGRSPQALLASYHALTDGTVVAGYGVGQDPVDGRFTWPQGSYANLGQPVPRGTRLLAAALAWLPWTPFDDPGPGLRSGSTRVALLRELRGRWRTAARGAPRVRPGDPDVDRTLLDLLTADAVSQTFDVRPFLGSSVLASTWHLLGAAPTAGATVTPSAASAVEGLLAALGLTTSRVPRLGAGGYTATGTAVTDEVVGGIPDEPPAWLPKLVEASPQKLHDGWTGPRVPLLARLLRHSLLQAYADAAMALVPPGGDPAPLPEPELVDLADLTAPDPVTPHTLTSWRHLAEAELHGRPVADVVHDLARTAPAPDAPQAVVDLVETLAAARRLADRPARALAWTLGTVLDVGSHRLDAWITALATDRLAQLRAGRPGGVHVGAFGVVTDLVPQASAAPVSTGYVHAPSMTHAVTAAVLRSGHLTHSGAGSANPFAVDLSSGRVRTALAVLDSVSQGQSLGAALGYRFERELYDRGQGRYLAAVRQIAPLEVGLLSPVPAGVDVGVTAPMTTTDGLALLDLAGSGLPWGTAPAGQTQTLPAPGSSDQEALLAAIGVVRDTADAIADIGLAESVHQLVLRNPVRAAATVDALTRGEVPVTADPDVLRTPRRGNGVTHRLLLVAPDPTEPAAAAALAHWTATDDQRRRHVRAAAEPRLDAWAATVLPDPATVRYRVAVTAPDGTGGDEQDLSLDGVGLSPYDVLASSSPDVADLGETNLGRRLLRHAAVTLERGAGLPAGSRLSLVLDRAPRWGAHVVDLTELLTLADRERSLVGSARPFTPGDLVPGAVGGADATLVARAGSAAGGLSSALTDLRTWFALSAQQQADLALAHPGPDAAVANLLDLPEHLDVGRAACAVGSPDLSTAGPTGPLADALDLLAGYGLPGAAATLRTGDDDTDRAALAVQARAAAAQGAARLAAAAASTASGDALAALESVFGAGFRALPLVEHGLTAAATPSGATASAVEEWLDDAAQVRDGAARLRDVLLAGELLGAAPVTWDVVQSPGAAGDPWVALPTGPGAPVPAGRTSVVAAATSPTWRKGARAAGLLVDAWVEVVPATSESTAVAFHLDSPDACAPQVVLLAVPADPAAGWSWDALADTVREAVDLARIRAVDPDLVPDVGHLVPTTFLAHNVGGDPAGDTISTVTEG